MEKKKIRFYYLLMPAVALLVYLLTELSSRHAPVVERWYSQGLYPKLAAVLSGISSWVPFSLDDLYYLVLLCSLPVLILFLILRRITLRGAGKIVLNVLAVSYILFYLFWGLNYYRPGLNQRLKLETRSASKDEFLNFTKHLIEQARREQCSLDDLPKQQCDSLVEASYRKLAPALGLTYPAGKRPDKTITFSRFFAQSGISGYYGPFFNEVHVNRNVLPLEYPVVLAHEKAHQFGITSEAEANFYAWLVCSQSNSKELRYTANLYLLRHFMNQAYQMEEFPLLAGKISPAVKADMNRIRKHWLELRNEKLDRAASTVNDAYLKTNKVEAGIQDYSGVVKLALDFSLDSAFQRKWNLQIN